MFFNNWFNTTCGFASLFSSITILTLCSLSDSSLISEIPSILFSLAKCAIFSINFALLTWYGSDVTIILCLLFDISSISVSALIIIFPRPVLYVFLIPSVPIIKPPVGKSGPLIIFIKSSSVTSSSSIIFTIPSITSLKLWGGILVAIPTAIPDDPFTKSAGIVAGSTVGSCNLSSKFGIKSTVFFSMSSIIDSAILDNLASV